MIRFNFHQILAIAEALMKRVVEGRNIGKCNDDTNNGGGVDNNGIEDGMMSDAKRDLCSLLMFHYSQSNDTITNIVQSVPIPYNGQGADQSDKIHLFYLIG